MEQGSRAYPRPQHHLVVRAWGSELPRCLTLSSCVALGELFNLSGPLVSSLLK